MKEGLKKVKSPTDDGPWLKSAIKLLLTDLKFEENKTYRFLINTFQFLINHI